MKLERSRKFAGLRFDHILFFYESGTEKILSSQEQLKVFNVKESDLGWYV